MATGTRAEEKERALRLRVPAAGEQAGVIAWWSSGLGEHGKISAWGRRHSPDCARMALAASSKLVQMSCCTVCGAAGADAAAAGALEGRGIGCLWEEASGNDHSTDD